MKEQSHKEEMASLLKADFERLRARGVATTLAPGQGVGAEREPEPAAAVALTPELAPPPAPEGVRSTSGEPAAAGGWLRRLLGSG